ncbi:MAG: DUF2752 domain-containing protein [Bacteroidales bacterium]|nr:DUF2752 domain-containing protein [Bacteroidales bacterium]
MTGRKRIFIVVSMIICGIAATVVYGMFDPAESAFFPKCPFLLLTGGLRCPGCGSQRAIHSLLHLEFKEAFLYNPLVIISIPFLILLAAAALVKESRPGFYNKVNSSLLSKTLLVIIIVWWIVRNIIGL